MLYKALIYSVIGVVLGAVSFREISSNFGDVVQILEICTTVFKFAPRIFREKDMATVTAFIRVSTKKTKEANVRFRLRSEVNYIRLICLPLQPWQFRGIYSSFSV